jgi:hypothetical protein
VREHPNWRRKLPLALERWSSHPEVATLAHIMAQRGLNVS